MPDVDFNKDNKSLSVFDMEMLRLKTGEKARIAIMDPKVKMQVAHYVRHSSFGLTNEGQIKGKYVVCLGDYETVKAEGLDGSRCPLCKVSEQGQEVKVSMPRRRFALHIARYRTNSKGVLSEPISLDIQVWVFGDDKFNKLVDRAEEHGDLRKSDMNLTCTSETYQNFDMDVGRTLVLAGDESGKKQYKKLMSMKNTDIDKLLGTAYEL